MLQLQPALERVSTYEGAAICNILLARRGTSHIFSKHHLICYPGATVSSTLTPALRDHESLIDCREVATTRLKMRGPY